MRVLKLFTVAMLLGGCDQISDTAVDESPVGGQQESVVTESEFQELSAKSMQAEDCDCATGDEYWSGQYVIMSASGDICELWYVCDPRSVCPNIGPPDPSTAGLFGVWKPEARNCNNEDEV